MHKHQPIKNYSVGCVKSFSSKIVALRTGKRGDLISDNKRTDFACLNPRSYFSSAFSFLICAIVLVILPVTPKVVSKTTRPLSEKSERTEERTIEAGELRLGILKNNSLFGLTGGDDDRIEPFDLFVGSRALRFQFIDQRKDNRISISELSSLHALDPRILWGSDLSPPTIIA